MKPEIVQSLVTIGLTCFNAEDTIGRAIASALSQDWPYFEVLIVDDCSTDNSVAVINDAIMGDERARLIQHELNKGPAAARNTLLREARGEFVVFFDDDDKSLNCRVTRQVVTIAEYEARTGNSLVACYAGGIRLYPNGYKKDLPAIGSRGREVPRGSGVADYLLLYRKRKGWFYGSGTPACSLMARKSLFLEVGGFDERLRRVEDVDFAIRLALKGGQFIGTSDRLFIQYASNAPDKSPEMNLESEQELVEKNKTYLDSIGRYYYALHWPKLRYWHFKHRYGRFTLELMSLIFRYPIEVLIHLIATGPQRIWHEVQMRRRVCK